MSGAEIRQFNVTNRHIDTGQILPVSVERLRGQPGLGVLLHPTGGKVPEVDIAAHHLPLANLIFK